MRRRIPPSVFGTRTPISPPPCWRSLAPPISVNSATAVRSLIPTPFPPPYVNDRTSLSASDSIWHRSGRCLATTLLGRHLFLDHIAKLEGVATSIWRPYRRTWLDRVQV